MQLLASRPIVQSRKGKRLPLDVKGPVVKLECCVFIEVFLVNINLTASIIDTSRQLFLTAYFQMRGVKQLRCVTL